MTTKNKQLKKRLRQKRLERERNLRKSIDKIGKQMMPMSEQGGFMATLYKIWRDFMLFIGEIKCTFGSHDWRLCSGRPGQPKYSCIRCWAKSKTLWEGTGSREHYANKLYICPFCKEQKVLDGRIAGYRACKECIEVNKKNPFKYKENEENKKQ